MRKWLGFGLIVLLTIGFIPAGFGILAKKSLDQLVKDFPMPDGTTLTLQDYTFGWLSSYVAFKVHVLKKEKNATYVADKSLDIIIHGNIAHGPFLMTDHGVRTGIARLDTHANAKDFHGLTDRGTKELELLFNGNDILTASSLFQAFKGITIDLTSSPVDAHIAGDNFQWQGFDAHIKVNHDFDVIDTQITFSPMLFTTQNDAALDAAQGEYMAKLYRENDSFWVGEQVFNLPTFYLKDELGAVLRFDHLHVMSNSNIIDGLLHASLEVKADNIEIDNQHIDQLRFDIEISNFANQPLLALSKIIQKPQPLSAVDKVQAFQLITEALSYGANVELDYVLNMENERVIVEGNLDFPNISDKAELAVPVKAQQLLEGLNARLEFLAPEATVSDLLFDMTWSALTRQMGAAPDAAQQAQIKQMIDTQIQSLVENGALVLEDGNYHLNFDYEQGNMILNQKPVTQGEVFLLLMLLLQVNPNESITN